MRYGLPKEEKPKKKWKASIENEIRYLQMEVGLLKGQLTDTQNKLTELLSSKQSVAFTFSNGLWKDKNPFSRPSKCDNDNFSSTNAHPFTSTFNANNDERMSTGYSDSHQENPFAPLHTEQGHYRSTWDYDMTTKKAIRLHSITCMPRYHKNEKSFEELRFEDYVLKGIGFSNQVRRFFKQRSEINNFTFTPQNWKPSPRKTSGSTNHSTSSFCIPWYLTAAQPKAPWPFGPSLESNRPKTSNFSASNNVLFSELSPTPIINKSNLEALQKKEINKCGKPVFVRRTGTRQYCIMQKKNYSDAEASNKDETLSSLVLLELRKMGEQISTLQDRLVKMDSNLSDVSSRVNVMDSRLSAVDMFVTMQRFDKKWQGLETRLANLESPSSDKNSTLSTNEIISEEVTHSQKIETAAPRPSGIAVSPFGDEKNYKLQISKSEESTIPITPTRIEAESSPAMDTSDIKLSDFVRSFSRIDSILGSAQLDTSNQSYDSTVSSSPFKEKMESVSIEMADLTSSHPLPRLGFLNDNLNLQENDSVISCSPPDGIDNSNESKNDSINNDDEKPPSSLVLSTGLPEGNKEVHEPEPQMTTVDKDNNNDIVSSDPLGVTDHKDSSSSTLGLMKEAETDEDNEFVIVEKADIDENWENSKTQANEASSNNEFKMYTDITEYLEINLGKKKDLVYEFGFEAKPDYLIGPEENSGHEIKDKHQENKATSSADESFQQFKTNFIGNKSVDAKQSSPFVFCNSKSPEKPSGSTFGGK